MQRQSPQSLPNTIAKTPRGPKLAQPRIPTTCLELREVHPATLKTGVRPSMASKPLSCPPPSSLLHANAGAHDPSLAVGNVFGPHTPNNFAIFSPMQVTTLFAHRQASIHRYIPALIPMHLYADICIAQDYVALELYAALVRNAKQVRPDVTTLHATITVITPHATISGHFSDGGVWTESTHRRGHAQTRPGTGRTTQVPVAPGVAMNAWMVACT